MPGSSEKKQSQPSSENLTAQSPVQTTGKPLEVPAPVALPPQYGSRPGANGANQTPTLPNGLPALQPKGVNVGNLFAENISDTNSRFTRLENAVSDLRREFETFKPSIVRLVAVESDIQDLIKQLDVLLRNEPPAQPVPMAAQPPTPLSPADQAAPPSPKPQPPPPQSNYSSSSGGPVVKSLRIGQHSGKVRLVMDASSQTPYTVDLDNQENLLVVELPEARWTGAMQQSFSRSALLNSYSVEPINNGNGSRVILSLKKSTQILKEQALPPGTNPNYRIFMDLTS